MVSRSKRIAARQLAAAVLGLGFLARGAVAVGGFLDQLGAQNTNFGKTSQVANSLMTTKCACCTCRR
jgi:hypothetical protein